MTRAAPKAFRRGPLFHIRRWEVRRHLPGVDDADVIRIGREVDHRHVASPWFWCWLVVSFALTFLLAGWIASALQIDLGSAFGMIYQGATFVIAMILFMVPVMWRERRLMRRVAREFGYAVCQHCGYDLRGRSTPSQHCPECGADFVDEVQ